MARIALDVLAGHPRHVTQHGNRRQKVFFREGDYRTDIDLLADGCRFAATACWAYCLMPNHSHLVLVPQSHDGLRKSLAEAHKRCTRQVNLRHGWRGHLWQERFHSFPMDEGHLLAWVRYVEQNPVKAGLTERPLGSDLLGRSQGSIVAGRYAEVRSPLVDGVLTACTVGAGASRSWDSAVDVALVIDVAFGDLGGWPWGETEGDVGDVDDDVVFETDVAPALGGRLSDPTGIARLEFVRLVTGLPLAGFYPLPLLGEPGYEAFNWLETVLLFATEVKADLEGKAGGAVGQNLDHSYGLEKGDFAYLVDDLGLPKKWVRRWLREMNHDSSKYAGSPEGRAYTAEYRDFSFDGRRPPRPWLSVHTTTDGLVLPSQETELRETLDATGRFLTGRPLRQTYVEANGHCVLTEEEWTRALEAMERQLDRGVWPGSGFFPNAPENGLRFNDAFDPGPYPQPSS